jgi:hypothetical protein
LSNCCEYASEIGIEKIAPKGPCNQLQRSVGTSLGFEYLIFFIITDLKPDSESKYTFDSELFNLRLCFISKDIEFVIIQNNELIIYLPLPRELFCVAYNL